MKITLVAVASVNGKMTNGDDPPSAWASAEDQTHFARLIANSPTIVMGRKTYERARYFMVHVPGKKRIVLTRDLARFAAEKIDGQLEFSSESPVVLVGRLEQEKCSEVLLVGGGEINAAFLQAGLVTDLLLTIEPEIFASGIALGSDFAKLQLQKVEQLNPRGTLLLHYAVVS